MLAASCVFCFFFFAASVQVVTSVLESLKSNDHPYHNHGVEVKLHVQVSIKCTS